MKKFRVFAEVKSYSILPKNANIVATIKVDGDTINIKIKNVNTIDIMGKEFSKKLSVIADVEAEDIMSSISDCMYFSNQILDKIAFEVGMPVEDMKVVKVFEIVDEGEQCDYIKFDFEALDRIGSKTLNLRLFDSIVNNANADRLNRAMHWYRKALNETDNLDIFSYLWISLETLNPLFQKKYPDSIEVSKCTNCNFEKKSIGTAALKRFFKDVLENEKLYSNSRGIRNSIVHGYEKIENIQKELQGIIYDLGIACRKAIIFLAELDMNLFNYDVGIGKNEGFTFILTMRLGNFITNEADARYFIPETDVEIEMSEIDNELVIKPIIKTNILNHGCSLAGLGWDYYGDPGYPIKKIQLEIRD